MLSSCIYIIIILTPARATPSKLKWLNYRLFCYPRACVMKSGQGTLSFDTSCSSPTTPNGNYFSFSEDTLVYDEASYFEIHCQDEWNEVFLCKMF